MKKMFEHHNTERVKVPDSDAYNWMKTLEEGGFRPDEIDAIMTHLNDTYASSRLKKYLDAEVAELEKIFGKGKELTAEQKATLREATLERIRNMNQSQLENRFHK